MGCFSIKLLHTASIDVFLCKNLFLLLRYWLNTELLSISLSKTQKRGNEESDHVSSIGPKVKMETDMHGFLRLSCFREELFSFFFKEIEGQIYAAIIVSKLLYIAIDKKT